jgi:methanogenic corrinoid protein MtbC1
VDQLQNKLPRRPGKERKVVVCCAPDEIHELGAQMAADLFESDGWEVRFIGGGLTNDDILEYINDYAPDVLLIYGTAAKQAPDVRRLIDRIRGVDAWPHMRIMLSGGVFNRAEDLWDEIGADLFAESAMKAVQVASSKPAAEPQGDRNRGRQSRKRHQPVAQVPVQV